MNSTDIYQNFLDNKYTHWYKSIIENAHCQDRKKLKKNQLGYIYYENHHILPKSCFPEYEKLNDFPWNSVLLTAREHFICHCLLTKMFEDQRKYKMLHALKATTMNGEYNSKTYEYYKNKIKHTQETKNKLSEYVKNNPTSGQFKTGYKHTEEMKIKMSETRKGTGVGNTNPFYGRTHTQETKNKISLAKKGTPPHNRGKPHNQETREKIKEAIRKSNVKMGDLLWCNDGVKNTRAKIIPEGYTKGRIKKSKPKTK